LLLSAVLRRPPLSIDIFCPRGAQQQTRSAPNDGTDRQAQLQQVTRNDATRTVACLFCDSGVVTVDLHLLYYYIGTSVLTATLFIYLFITPKDST